MAPPRKHDTDGILDAARTLVLRDGARAASVAAIATESGAPVGTLYHRFGSRDAVLAAAWLRALARFQEGVLAAAAESDSLEAAVAMATTQIRFARRHPDDVRLLLAIRRSDLLDADPDDTFRAQLATMNAPLDAALLRLTRALRGRPDARARDAVVRAVVDLPNAAVRRHLRGEGAIPRWLDGDVAAAVRSLLSA